MTNEEVESCIRTIEMLRKCKLKNNQHGVMNVIDAGNCEKIIKMLSDEHLKMCEEEQELCDDVISRQVVKDKYRERLVNSLKDDDRGIDLSKYAEEPYKAFCEFMDSIPPVKREPKTGQLTNSEWIDFLSEQFDISRTSAKEMLHVMMSVKKADNFKKQFSGRK